MVSIPWAASGGAKGIRVSLCKGGGHTVKFRAVRRASQHTGDVWRVLGLVVGSGGVASVGLAASAVAVENPNPGRTYIVDCQGELEYKPKEIVFACGDGGVYIDKITWSKRNMNRAIGRGTSNYNTCEPNCGAGNVLTYKVRLRLNQSATGPGKGAFVNTLTSLTGTFGADAGPAMAASSTWVLDNPIED